MACVEMLKSRTSEAATSSCVESGLEAQRTTSAPPSRSVMARLAVSVVTCRHAETRMPFNGWFLINSLRILWSNGIDWFAHSMRRLPRSANARLLISNEICGAAVVDMFSLHDCRKRLELESWIGDCLYPDDQRRDVACYVSTEDLLSCAHVGL